MKNIKARTLQRNYKRYIEKKGADYETRLKLRIRNNLSIVCFSLFHP